MGCWFGDRELILTFPDRWKVVTFRPEGGRDISEEGIRDAFEKPIGTRRIRELARRKGDRCRRCR